MTGSTRIRDATPADARAIASVHHGTWRTTYRGQLPDAALDQWDIEQATSRRERLLAELPADQPYLVAEVDGAVVGFAHAGPERDGDPGRGEVYAIYILADQQRRGVGRALLTEATSRLHALGLRGLLIWVLRENLKGRSFYERMGGRAECERPFEIAGALITETGYVWDDTSLLRSRSVGGSSGSTQRM